MTEHSQETWPPESTVPPAEAAAARWLARLSSGEASDAERAEYQRWLAADPAHADAIAALRTLWLALGPRLQPPPAAARQAAPRRNRRPVLLALAASLLFAVALTVLVAPDLLHDEATGTGERRSLVLADGSRLLLNSRTALDVDLGAGRRSVDLARGEVWFEVAPDPARPFFVRSGDAEVRVLGTRFGVRRHDDGVRVNVEEGRVEVHSASGGTVLGAGQRVDTHGGALGSVETVETMPELAWRDGRLILTGASLADVADALAPHYRGTLLQAGDGLRRFNAVIDLERIDDWLTALDRDGGVQVLRIGPVVVLRERG